MDIQLSGIKVVIPRTNRILFKIDQLQVPRGTKMLIHGRSGIGKTTLLHLIAGLFLPTSGKVLIDEINICLMTESQRCRMRQSYFAMFLQKLNLIDHLTALENVHLGLHNSTDAHERAMNGLKELGVESLANQLTGNLSMGEQQRIALARIIAARPKIVLADEPTSSLDEENAKMVIEALFSLSPATTLIVVSHDNRIRSRFSEIHEFEKLVSK